MPISVLLSTAQDDGLRPGLSAEQVSPGVIGFAATFLVVVVCSLLIWDFVRRQRRLRYRLEYLREREAQEAEHPGAERSGSARPGQDDGGATAASSSTAR